MAGKPNKAGTKKSHSLAGKILLAINFLAVILLLLAYLAPFVSPEHFTIIAFFGIAYPVTLLINLIFIVVWMILGKWRMAFSIIAILLGYNHLRSLFQFHIAEDKEGKQPAIKILTYNVRVFDHFNRKNNIQIRNKIFDYLKTSGSDIYCFQEFYDNDNGSFPVLDTLTRLLQSESHVTEYFNTHEKHNHAGIVTMTKLHIINRENLRLNQNSSYFGIFTDILAGTDTIRVFNLHLESIKFSNEDYSFYNDISKQKDKDKLRKGSSKILSKLYDAFKKRAAQSDMAKQLISRSPYPVIVCGDFNDTPTSYSYRQISGKLKDSFMERGLGLGKTYIGIFPSFRIDYILHDTTFICNKYNRGDVKYSDHYPVMAILNRK